mmetsp:Transcript_27256/g.65889  ORF Transcript_27256/g.65889 Transcript_27256/m.65889 type:complete len:94 (-) Transcript_27256:124-405(-)
MNICDEGKFLDNEQAVAELRRMTRSANASCVRSWTSVRLMKDILHVHEVQFYHYQAIIKLVGTRNKQRAQLLACAMSEIRSRHGENEVGYVQA